jgi:hypothetical protein
LLTGEQNLLHSVQIFLQKKVKIILACPTSHKFKSVCVSG